jgi:2-phospho-L-lactate transferase/gluconeogenesis factor (CofD/UPF0052 family)
MTQPGETDNYTVANHLQAIERVCARPVFDAVLAQKTPPSPLALERYAREQSHPVYFDRERVGQLGYRVILANVMTENEKTGQVRHDPHRLARVLWRWFTKK